jgi:hypothetical protein
VAARAGGARSAKLLGLAHRLQESNPMMASVIAREGALPDFDLPCPLFSLPRAFGTTIETIPGVRSAPALGDIILGQSAGTSLPANNFWRPHGKSSDYAESSSACIFYCARVFVQAFRDITSVTAITWAAAVEERSDADMH